jgi:hypothetical protein
MNSQTRLVEISANSYPSREQHRQDCCDRCLHMWMDDCVNMIRRCWPHGELLEQCHVCKPCIFFKEHVQGGFVTAFDLLHGGTVK